MKAARAAIAGAVVVLWLGGLGLMLRRNANRSDAQNLADVALRLQPSTFYYLVEHDGQQIGAASSSLDTTAQTLVSEEYFVGSYPSSKGLERTSARWQTRLTRGFRLADLTIDIARADGPFAIHAAVEEDTTLFVAGEKRRGGRRAARTTITPPLFTPSLAPIAFMLGGDHEIGRTQRMSVFDPITRTAIRPELVIRADSVFTVVDSAALTKGGEWTVAHRDTVRAWRIEGAPNGVSAWVDDEGRIVAAKAGGYSVIRTAFEIAFKNSKAK